MIPKDGGDGIITAHELALFLRDEVEKKTIEGEKLVICEVLYYTKALIPTTHPQISPVRRRSIFSIKTEKNSVIRRIPGPGE